MAVLLGSCYDFTEVDNITYIVAVGVDRGISDKWRLTIKFPIMKEQGGGDMGGNSESGAQGGYGVLTVDAPSFFTGLDMINTTVGRRLNFMHTKLLVFSEELAREGIVGEFLAPIVRYREIRRTMHIAVCSGSAMEFIEEVKPLQGTDLSKSVEVLMEESTTTGFFPHSTLYRFYNDTKSTYWQPISMLAGYNDFEAFKETGDKWGQGYKPGGDYYAGGIPRRGGAHIEFFGSAIFNGDKMVDKLNGNETRLLMMVLGEFRKGIFTIPDPVRPELIIPLDVRAVGHPDLEVRFEGDKAVIDAVLNLEGDLLAVQSRVNYEDETLIPQVEKAFCEHIKTNLDALIYKCQELNVDIFRFGAHAIMNFNKFPTIQEWEKYNWHEHFKNADVTTKVDFKIERTGNMLISEPIVTNKGKE